MSANTVKANKSHDKRDLVIAKIWGGDEELFRDGFFVIPSRFLRGYSAAAEPITNSEFMFLLQLMSHKWTEEKPYPSYRRLAQLLGITERMARRHASSLEKKGYFTRARRLDKKTEYDLSPLFKKIPSFPMTRADKTTRSLRANETDIAAIAERMASSKLGL